MTGKILLSRLSLFHLSPVNINGKQGVNSLFAYRASNGVYLLLFMTVSVGLHAHQLSSSFRIVMCFSLELVQGLQKPILIQGHKNITIYGQYEMTKYSEYIGILKLFYTRSSCTWGIVS